MSSDLKPALQLTLPSAELDGHMLLILAIMVLTGMLGGAANYFLSERERPHAPHDWVKYPVFGVVAALTVPLFLNMISSTLLEGARSRPVDFFVFGGFCLIYVVASRHLFENLMQRLLGQLAVVSRDVSSIRRKQDEEIPPPPRVEPEAVRVEAPRPPEPDPLKVMSYQDIEILRTVGDGGFICGNLAAICERTSLQRELVGQRLNVLKNLGVIETRISDKNVLHWVLSANGRAVLDEALAGSEGRRAG